MKIAIGFHMHIIIAGSVIRTCCLLVQDRLDVVISGHGGTGCEPSVVDMGGGRHVPQHETWREAGNEKLCQVGTGSSIGTKMEMRPI